MSDYLFSDLSKNFQANVLKTLTFVTTSETTLKEVGVKHCEH